MVILSIPSIRLRLFFISPSKILPSCLASPPTQSGIPHSSHRISPFLPLSLSLSRLHDFISSPSSPSRPHLPKRPSISAAFSSWIHSLSRVLTSGVRWTWFLSSRIVPGTHLGAIFSFFPHLAGLAYGIVSSLFVTSFCFTQSGHFTRLFSFTYSPFIQTVLFNCAAGRQPLLPHSDKVKPNRFLPIHPLRIAFFSVASHFGLLVPRSVVNFPGEESPANRFIIPTVR